MSDWNEAALAKRIVRYHALKPCLNAFVDSRTPGSDKKENFTIIGPGVSENPDQHVHIPEPHGFNIGGARQPPGCLNSQHSHDTAEVFIVHTGRWRFMWGANADDGSVELGPGDTISIPIHMFRGFENIGDDIGFLFAVLGGDHPGKVTWAPRVFDLAQDYGLVLLKGGRLIDTTKGEAVPANAERESPPDPETIRRLSSPTDRALAHGVLRIAELEPNPQSPLAAPGVEECAVITPTITGDGFRPGPIVGWWHHGFNLRCLKLAGGSLISAHRRREEEVVFVQSGALDVAIDGVPARLAAGDVLSVPKIAVRQYSAAADTVAFVVRGGDAPAAPEFADARAAA